MGLEYYGFASFIAGLICLVAVIFKVLFSNVKRQHKLLDEKETKLLQLYRTVENIMEEFNDQAKATTDELKEYEKRTAARLATFATMTEVTPAHTETMNPMLKERVPRAERVDSGRMRAAGEVLARAGRINRIEPHKTSTATVNNPKGAVFQQFFAESSAETPPAEEAPPSQQLRNEAILALAGEGKTHAQIASALGITQNEVKLVIGLTGGK